MHREVTPWFSNWGPHTRALASLGQKGRFSGSQGTATSWRGDPHLSLGGMRALRQEMTKCWEREEGLPVGNGLHGAETSGLRGSGEEG